MKLLVALLLTAALPAMGAQLKGSVKVDEQRGVNNAKIVIFHDLALVLVQRVSSDRNGNYQVVLEPGPYRVFVLKKGFEPVRETLILEHEDQTLELSHLLIPRENRDTDLTTNSLKHILRRTNREPHKDVAQPQTGTATALQQPQTEMLHGTLKTAASTQQNGANGSHAQVDLQGRLSQDVAFASRVVNHAGVLTPDQKAMQVQAGLQMDWQKVNMDLGLESIRPASGNEDAQSKAVHLGMAYGSFFTGRTQVDYKQSQDTHSDFSETGIMQDLSHRFFNKPASHEIEWRQWDQSGITTAKLAQVESQWRPLMDQTTGGIIEVDQLWLEDQSFRQSKLWLSGQHSFSNQKWQVESRVGAFFEDDTNAIVQDHKLQAYFGSLAIQLHYLDDYGFRAYNHLDIYGAESVSSITPYAQESFYRNSLRDRSLHVGYTFSSGWNSTFSIEQINRKASLLQAYQPQTYSAQAAYDSRQVAYSLAHPRLGSKINYRYKNFDHKQGELDEHRVSYSQFLNIFRSSDMGLIVEFEMGNRPEIPGWWLFTQSPYNNAEDQWYEGSVTLLF